MASGVVHSRFGKLIIASNTVLAVTRTHQWTTPGFAVGTIVGTVAGWLMPPDLDLPQRTFDEWRILARRPIIGRFWVGFWASYGQMFRHRGLSHVFILGTLSRIVWIMRHLFISLIFMVAFAAYGYISFVRAPDFSLWFQPRDFWYGVVAGWVVQDAGHLFLDGILHRPDVAISRKKHPRKKYPRRFHRTRKRLQRKPAKAFKPLLVEF